MITRRALLLTTATGLLATTACRTALAQTAGTDDPRSIINAIYTRVTRGKGDSGGGFVTLTKSARARYLSRSLAALWLKADARVQKGDGDPVGFDPVTNSQDPDVKSFTMATENFNSQRATIAVTITGHNSSRGQAGRRGHPLRFRQGSHGSRSLEDRRHPWRRRRQAVVGAENTDQLIQVLTGN